MESGIEAPLHSSPTAKSNDGSDLVVDSLSLHPSPTMSSPALLTASSSTLAETVKGGSLSLPSSTLEASVSLSTPDPVSQVQATDSPLGSDNTLAQATDSFSLSTENVNASVSNGLSISLNVPPPSALSQQQVAMTQDVNKSQAHPSETAQDTTKFVPTLGAWAKPLFFKPHATPPEPSTPRDYDPALVGTQLATLWPSLNDEILNKKPKSKHPTRTLQPPIEKLPPPELKADGSLRFPWAARLSPQSRNLYRAATPTYRLDGTPEVSIPSKVLKLGPENKDEYIIGKFHRCSLPPGGLVHAVVNRIWRRSCKISCKKIGESSFMFHIPHEPTRHWVIQRGVWHIDNCLLFVLPWTPEGSFKIPEISTLPVWVTLKNIPDCCYSRLGISHVASGLGEPILTHKPRLDPTSMGEAKVLVEMELDRDFPKLIALDDKQGSIFLVNVEYTWIPSTCERCGNLGHKAKRCLLPPKPASDPTLQPQTTDVRSEIPVVDIDLILQQKDCSTSTPEVFQSTTSKLDGQGGTVPVPALPSVEDVHDLPSGTSVILDGTGNQILGTSFTSSHFQQEKPADLSNSVPTLPRLVDSSSTPIVTQIMESFPSSNINTEVLGSFVVGPLTTTPNHCVFQSPSVSTVIRDGDEVEIEPSSSFSLTRGGRESKPPIKYENMEWKTVRGRGKRGRRGRGSYH